MARFTCLFAELDDDTREYLAEVRRRAGNRTPGVYFPGTNLWPVGAILLGPAVIVGGIVWAASSAKDAWAVALLLTAAVVLGGWLIVYAFRRWLGTASPHFAGYFTFFDPNHVYQAAGDEVTVTDVSDFDEVSVRHSYSEGKYQSSTVRFNVRGRAVSVPVSGEARADLVEEFYRSVLWLEAHEDPRWRNLPAAELGGVAKYVAVEDDLPRDMKDVDLEVTAAPEEPRKAGKAGGVLRPYLVILAVGGAVYLATWLTMRPTGDYLAFEASKGSPTGLRAYLLDDRNTRYRDEALQKLAAFYDPALAKAAAVKDPEERKGLTAVLDGLKTATTPATAIAVEERDTPEAAKPAADARMRMLRTDLADALGQYLGKELIAFVGPVEGVKPHVELSYRFEPAEPWGYRVLWRLTFRGNPEDAGASGPERALPRTYGPNEGNAVPNDLKTAVFQELFGVPPPFIVPAAPPGGGNWDD